MEQEWATEDRGKTSVVLRSSRPGGSLGWYNALLYNVWAEITPSAINSSPETGTG